VSGDVRFDGTLRADGTYSFLTHSGDMVIGVPENSSAYIRTATGNGDVTASFALPPASAPAAAAGVPDRERWRLGRAGNFSGDIRLVRPSEMRTRTKRRSKCWH
jgi:hypothetical protein